MVHQDRHGSGVEIRSIRIGWIMDDPKSIKRNISNPSQKVKDLVLASGNSLSRLREEGLASPFGERVRLGFSGALFLPARQVTLAGWTAAHIHAPGTVRAPRRGGRRGRLPAPRRGI